MVAPICCGHLALQALNPGELGQLTHLTISAPCNPTISNGVLLCLTSLTHLHLEGLIKHKQVTAHVLPTPTNLQTLSLSDLGVMELALNLVPPICLTFVSMACMHAVLCAHPL